MSFVFCDNFAHYEGTGDLRRKWTQISDSSVGQSPHVLLAPNSGVYGSPKSTCLSLGQAANDFIKRFPAAGHAEVFFNGYFQLRHVSQSSSNRMLLRFTDVNGSQQVVRFLGTSNFIRAEHGSGSTSGTHVVKFYPEWNYLAVRIKVDPAVGVFQIYLNGDLDVNFSGNTQGSALTTTQENFHLAGHAGQNTGTGYTLWDHVLVYNGGGASMNTLITDRIQVQTLRPTADNGAQQWLLSTGANHYALVDENITDTSDFLIGTNVAGDKDNFDLENLPRTATTVHTVVPTAYARRTDATGTNNLRLAVVSSGVSGLSGNIAMAAQSDTYTHSVDVDPNTLAAWGSAAVDAAILRLQVGT